MTDLAALVRDLVVANRILAAEDIVELNLDCTPVKDDGRPLYHERFIHGGIYETRPDVQAVVHAHSADVLPFSIAKTPLRPVIHSGSFMGLHVPVWDIADRFGPKMGPYFWLLAQGAGDTEVTSTPHVAKGHSREVTFQENLTDPAELADQVRALARHVAQDVAD